MYKIPFLIFTLLLLGESLVAQTAYPLCFHWQGELEDGRPFEAMISMIDSDKALNGKGSRLKGRLIWLDDWSSFELSGQADRSNINFNCYDSLGTMLQSFRFPKVAFREKEQIGEWTDGTHTKSVNLEMLSPELIPRSLRDGFAEGINFRAERLSEAPMLKGLEHPILNKMGEGYLMKDKAFEKVKHYGQQYICFTDTVEDRLMQLDWILMNSSSLFVLETQQIWKKNQLEGVELHVWSYRGGKWAIIDAEVFPAELLKEEQLVLPQDIKSFKMSSQHLFFKIKDTPKPLVLEWDRNLWKLKK